ncbi:hypothetical protein SSX86_020544 [Deinandra increscens subsp. villosa]|uniref:Replication factor A C-terminal domain-containing protein n=1 Tax=Deinandra increscens subsp. villosa TaxID=3103831 RepID=A0AAP0CSX7_9ASTR
MLSPRHVEQVKAVGIHCHLLCSLNSDYIGRVDDVEHAEVSSSNSVLRLKITTPWTKPVMLALWKEIHSTLDLSPIIDADDDIVVAFTALKVVPHQRDVQLQSTGGTRVIISPQLPIARDMAERFRANRQGTPVAKISLRTVRNLDTVAESDVRTMGHLYQQESGRLKDVHTVETTITDFTSGRGWFFVTCTACNKRIYENNMEFSCSKHRQQHLNYSYSVNCTIEDHTGSANVTIFDRGVLTMIGIRCYDMFSEKGFTDHKQLPPQIAALRGTKWLIQVKGGERYDNNLLKFTANTVLPIDKKTPKALPAPEAKDSELLCITDGLPSKARKKLFTDPENDTTDEQQVLNPGVEDSTTKMEPDIAHESIETVAPVEANNSGKTPGLKRKLKQEP